MNYLVLSGANACLEEGLPILSFSTNGAPTSKESVEGHLCAKEKLVATGGNGPPMEVLIWRAQDLGNFPVKIQIAESNQTFCIRLRESDFKTIPTLRFHVPAGFARYSSFEDLMQSVLLEKMKKRMGLE